MCCAQVESELYPEITDDQLAQSARGEEHLRLVRELEIRSAILVPLRVPTRTLGVMTLVTAESRRRLNQDDLELAEQLARRAAVAVENARLHTTLSEIADTLQQSLLPEPLPAVPGWEIAALYRPAGGEQRVDVGGDFYEVFSAERDWFAIIGDVTGKGIAAAALTSLLRHGSRFASANNRSPAAILSQLDEALRSRSRSSLCTALCMRLHDDHVVISSAGHPHALHISADGAVREAPVPGPLLGAFANAAWPEERLDVAPGEMLLVYTDGVTDTRGERERFGAARLRRLLTERAGMPPQRLLSELQAALDEFQTEGHADDTGAVALRAAEVGSPITPSGNDAAGASRAVAGEAP